MSTPFVVAFVVGVTPGKWARTWNERMPHLPLELRATSAALDEVLGGSAQVALVRLGGELPESLSVIPLYSEAPFVVAPKDHVFEAVDSVTLAEVAGENPLEVDPHDASGAIELVAANVGVAVMPQSVARAHSRRDVIARPVTDAAVTTIALVWVTANTTPQVEEFIGIVRGRTANSSRGTATVTDAAAKRAAARPARPARPSRAPRPTGKRPPRKKPRR